MLPSRAVNNKPTTADANNIQYLEEQENYCQTDPLWPTCNTEKNYNPLFLQTL